MEQELSSNGGGNGSRGKDTAIEVVPCCCGLGIAHSVFETP